MHDKLIFCSFMLLATCAATKDNAMAHLFDVDVRCQGSHECIFEQRDVHFDVVIVNKSEGPIGFPLAFRQKTGPVVRLVDPRTRREFVLRTNLADLVLRDEFTMIPSGGSATLQWVIARDEIEQFGARDLDLVAEVTLAGTIAVGASRVDDRASGVLRIVSKDRVR